MANGTWGGTGDRHPFKVKISWTQQTSLQQTGFHVRATGAEIGDAQSVADEVQDWVDDSFRALLGSGDRVLGVDVVDMVTREGYSTAPSSMYGGQVIGGGAHVPAFLSAVINLKSALRTRHGQGRMFWPIRAEQQVDGDVLSASTITAFQSAIDALTSRFVGGSFAGYSMCNVHGVIAPRAATTTTPARAEIPPSWYDVIGIRLNTNVTALRSRKMSVGS